MAKKSDLSCYEKMLDCGGNCFGCLRAWLPCICCCVNNPFISVKTGNDGLKETFGRFSEIFKPGLHRINPWTEKV